MQLVPFLDNLHFEEVVTVLVVDSFDEFFEMYAPQTKILEGGTKDDIRIFD